MDAYSKRSQIKLISAYNKAIGLDGLCPLFWKDGGATWREREMKREREWEREREREREKTSPNMQLQHRKVSEDGFDQYNTHEKYIIIHCL